MKTILLPILITLFLSGTGNCKTKQNENEFSLSYGFFSTNGALIDEFSNIFVSMFSFGTVTSKIDNIRNTGPFFISYKHIHNSMLGIGFTVGFSHLKYDLEESSYWWGYDNSKFLVDRSYSTFAPEIDFRYMKKENFNLYSMGGIGYTFVRNNYRNVSDQGKAYIADHLDFQITVIGIRFGKDFGGFFEMGFGYKGVMNFGLNYRL